MLILILFKIGITNFLSSRMLLLLSYCSVFKVQICFANLKQNCVLFGK